MTPPPPPGGASSVTYSPWIKRVGGYIIRAVVAAVPMWIGIAIGGAIGGAIGVLLTLAAVVFGVGAAIRMLIQRGHLGYDCGDAVVGQRLVKADTGQVLGSGGMVFVRLIAHIVDSIPCYIGYLWPLWDAKRQTFADKIMTTVVTEESTRQHEASALIQNAFMIWKPVIKN